MVSSLETTDHAQNEDTPQCFSKVRLSQTLNRDRRASISRPYFHHWRQSRDNSRYIAKNSLAFSPRLGKRADENENELENADDQLVYQPVDLDAFLVALIAQLQEKNIDIVYEDSTMICLSQPINDSFIQQILDQNDQENRETRRRQAIGKHPVLFRYRLG